MTSRTEQPADETEVQSRHVGDSAMSIFRALVMDEQYHPIAVANGFLSASLAIFAGISSTDEVRRMLHRLGDELLGGDNEPPQTNH